MKTLDPTHILTRLVNAKRKQLADVRLRVPDAIVRKMASEADRVPSLCEALRSDRRVRIIAEIKKASPSAGVLIPELEVRRLAAAYREGGAIAISIVTEESFFGGRLGWVREAGRSSGLPVLRKDFVFDRYQVFETRAAGASALLLIAAILEPDELRELIETVREVGLDAVVEVHDEAELAEALDAGASVIGVNNRDLKTFEVELETSVRLGKLMPENILFVAESGIKTKSDVERLRAAGADAFLVGEGLLTAPDPCLAIRELL